MNETEIIKLINSNSKAIEENLLFSTELESIKNNIEKFLDQNIKGEGLLALRYRKFKKSRYKTLYSDLSGFPGDGKKWLEPIIDFFQKYMAEKTIKKRLEDENLWIESRIQGSDQHLLIGERNNSGDKVHLIVSENGEIRIDKKDKSPCELLKKVEVTLTTANGKVVKTISEYYKEKVDTLIRDAEYGN